MPTGSTEQHGPHGPLLTDVLVPNEVARRVAPHVGAVVAPPINYALSYPHVGFTGVVHIRIPTFMALVEDLCASLAAIGLPADRLPQRPLRQHLRDRLRLRERRRSAAAPAPRAFPVNYWDGMTAEEAGEFFGPSTGLHANRGETSAVLAIDPALVDLDAANAEMPPFPEVTSPAPVHTAFFFSAPGSVHRATHSGTWGDAREATRRIRRALPRGRDRGDDPDARRHRAHLRGDAAALTGGRAVAGEPGPAAHRRGGPRVAVELDEVGPLARPRSGRDP